MLGQIVLESILIHHDLGRFEILWLPHPDPPRGFRSQPGAHPQG